MIPEPTAEKSTASPDGWIVVDQTPEGFAFRPVHRWVIQRVLAMLAFGTLGPLMITVAAQSWTKPGGPPVWVFVSCAIITGIVGFAAGAYLWRFRATPLIAERSGRISYGSRVLLEPGATRRLNIERVADSEGELAFTVVSDNRWGPVVRIETPYLGAFSTHAAAYWFAAQLGGAIGAEVISVEPCTETDGGTR